MLQRVDCYSSRKSGRSSSRPSSHPYLLRHQPTIHPPACLRCNMLNPEARFTITLPARILPATMCCANSQSPSSSSSPPRRTSAPARRSRSPRASTATTRVSEVRCWPITSATLPRHVWRQQSINRRNVISAPSPSPGVHSLTSVELGVVIGKDGRNISAADAESYIAGYSESLNEGEG